MADLTALDRFAAIQRASRGGPFWGVGCLRPVVYAWPDAFAAVSASAAVRAYRADGVGGVMALTPLGRGVDPEPADPVELRLPADDRAIAGLRVARGWLVLLDGRVTVLNEAVAELLACWRAEPCRL